MGKKDTRPVKHVLQLRTDGSYDIIPVRGEPSLPLLQRLIGRAVCVYSSAADFAEPLIIACSGNTRSPESKQLNRAATVLSDYPGNVIHGPAAVMSIDDDNYEYAGLDSEVVGHIINALRYMDVLGEHIDGRDYRRQKGAGE